MITIDEFKNVDIRVGQIIEVNDYPEARKPSYLMKIDFGEEIGVKQSIGQFTHYGKEELKNRLVAGVVNLPPFRMGSEKSETLTLGFPDQDGKAVLVVPESEVPVGGKIF